MSETQAKTKMLEAVGLCNGKIVDLNNKIEKAVLRLEQGNEPHD